MNVRSKVDFKFVCLLLIIVGVGCFWIFHSEDLHSEEKKTISSLNLNAVLNLPKTVIENGYSKPSKLIATDLDCKMYSCFDVYKCGNSGFNHITVYLYPLTDYVDPNSDPISAPISREFYEIYTTIASSKYFVDSPEEACLFIPPIDLLNQNGLNVQGISLALASLPYWNHGSNNLLFNMLPGRVPDFSTTLDMSCDKAIIAGGGFSHWTYRSGFDVSIPVFSPIASSAKLSKEPDFRKWLLTSAQVNLHNEYRQVLESLACKNCDFLILHSCQNAPEEVSSALMARCRGDEQMQYPHILQESTFCLILPTHRFGDAVLSEALKTGCIPVIACDTYVLPFSEVLDWKRAAIVIRERDLGNVLVVLKGMSMIQIQSMRSQGKFFYEKYFSSVSSITLTTLEILNGRVFPDAALSHDDWNTPPDCSSVHSPLLLPIDSPLDNGFTAVILAYDRIESLFQLVNSIDKVPSLRMIIVVWNNQDKAFPPKKEWPIVDHQLQVISTSANKLSNRFFPYNEIKTEAVLAIDDDIIMLTSDEIEFGYQVWREFPDRIVGFPSRLHVWTENGKLKYESEWKNDISIVLTGAAFYHNYFNHLYTYKMPGDIRDWVNEHMNCEDIAMNFIATNHTGKAPIKVTPRKKFKCSECATGGSLSLDEKHMVERSTCINYFMDLYGMLPLKSVDFRADPVLYKDDFPDKLKQFPDMGML